MKASKVHSADQKQAEALTKAALDGQESVISAFAATAQNSIMVPEILTTA